MELAKMDKRKSRKSDFIVRAKRQEKANARSSSKCMEEPLMRDHPTIMLRSGRISIQRSTSPSPPPDTNTRGYAPVPREERDVSLDTKTAGHQEGFTFTNADATVTVRSDTEDTDSVQPGGPLAGTGCQTLVTWEPFQGFMATLIVGNAVIMGMETDLPSRKWDVLEVVFLVAFTAELILRLLVVGHRAYFNYDNKDFRWNMFDFLVVGLGIIDLMVHAVFHSDRNVSWMAVFRMVRLLRVLRILRIVRFLKQLYQLAFGISLAGGAIFWVSVLFSAIFYMCSIVLVRTLGSVDDEGEVHDFVRMKFGTIGRSMRTLFELMVAPDLEAYMRVIVQYPLIGSFLIAFIVYASFGMSAVVTGVITESMFEKNMVKVENQRTEKEQERKQLMHECAAIFDQFQPNEKGEVSSDDLVSAVPQIQAVLESHSADFPNNELERMIEIMDLDGSGTIDKREFTQSIVFLAEEVGPALLMELHFAGIQAIRETIRDSTQAVVDVVLGLIAQENQKKDLGGSELAQKMRNVDSRREGMPEAPLCGPRGGDDSSAAPSEELEVAPAPLHFSVQEDRRVPDAFQSRVSQALVDFNKELKSGLTQLRTEIERLREAVTSQTLNLPTSQDFPKLPPPPRSTSKVRDVSPHLQVSLARTEEQHWTSGHRDLLAEDDFREPNGASDVIEQVQGMHIGPVIGDNGLRRPPFGEEIVSLVGGAVVPCTDTAAAVAAARAAVAGISMSPSGTTPLASPSSSTQATLRQDSNAPSLLQMGEVSTMQAMFGYSTVPSTARSAI